MCIYACCHIVTATPLPVRLYFGEHNVPGMFAVLQPLHGMMENGPETLKEISFNHVSTPHVHTHKDSRYWVSLCHIYSTATEGFI